MAASVGNHREASPAAMQSQLVGSGELGLRQDVQKLDRTSEELTSSMRSSQLRIQLVLTVQRVTETANNYAEIPAH